MLELNIPNNPVGFLNCDAINFRNIFTDLREEMEIKRMLYLIYDKLYAKIIVIPQENLGTIKKYKFFN